MYILQTIPLVKNTRLPLYSWEIYKEKKKKEEERERERKRSSSKFLSVKTCKEQRIVQVVQSTKCKMSSPFAVQATESTKIFEKT